MCVGVSDVRAGGWLCKSNRIMTAVTMLQIQTRLWCLKGRLYVQSLQQPIATQNFCVNGSRLRFHHFVISAAVSHNLVAHHDYSLVKLCRLRERLSQSRPTIRMKYINGPVGEYFYSTFGAAMSSWRTRHHSKCSRSRRQHKPIWWICSSQIQRHVVLSRHGSDNCPTFHAALYFAAPHMRSRALILVTKTIPF